MTTRSPRFLFAAALAPALAAIAGAAPATEVARIAFVTGEEAFELSPASGGDQTLTVAARTAEVQWVGSDIGQKFSNGQLALRIPVATGESIVPAKPLAIPGGGTLFVFTRTTAPSAPAITGNPAAVASTAPPVLPAPGAAATPAPVAPRAVIAPATSVVTSTLIAPAPISPPPAANPPVAGGGADPGLTAVVRQLLPAPEKLDPLSRADFAIPESPGAAVLDQSVQTLRPATPRETVTSLLSNFDPGGALKTGFSIAFTPYTMLRTKKVTLYDYNHSDWTRFFTSLQVSLAAKTGPTAAGATATPALFGLGLSGVFFDGADPRRDSALLEKLAALFPTTWGTQQDSEAIALNKLSVIPLVEQREVDAHRAITQAAQNARWNAAAMGFGYAVRLQSATGQLNDARDDGGGAWLNLSLPGVGSLAANSQFLFTGSYRYHDPFTRDGVSGIEDTLNLAAQYRVGARDFNGFAEAIHHWRAPRTGARVSDTTLELGVEKKMVDGLWLNVSWTNDQSLGGNSAIKTGLRYGFGDAATLGDVR